jgi:AcrR family transcriptional regulator
MRCAKTLNLYGQFSGSVIYAADYARNMAPAPRKKTPTVPAAKKPRLSQAEATARMINATGQLLLENVPGDVTVARICDRSGVHTDYVARYFGSREELMCQAIETSFLGFFLTNNRQEARVDVVVSGNVNFLDLVQKMFGAVTYLLGCGISPERFQGIQKLSIDAAFAEFDNANVSERARMNLVLVGFLVIQGMSTLGEVNSMTKMQRQDMMEFIGYLRQAGEDVQSVLGWDKPKKAASKKSK